MINISKLHDSIQFGNTSVTLNKIENSVKMGNQFHLVTED